ncbi:hypothetical protein JTB14_021788 [Gonioctena quinquepunctata]|nr:hypothetical protein JTB14_021788 [Gonioctena quinquepunctata]
MENGEEVGVPKSNPYVFGLASANSTEYRFVRACNLMKLYSEKCGASEPHILRRTKLRKHIATQATVLHLNYTDIIDLATFMGHKEEIHRDHYRIPIGFTEVGIISTLLEKAQGYCDPKEPLVLEESLEELIEVNLTDLVSENNNEPQIMNTFESPLSNFASSNDGGKGLPKTNKCMKRKPQRCSSPSTYSPSEDEYHSSESEDDELELDMN